MPRPFQIDPNTNHLVVRTRSGDQLHTAYVMHGIPGREPFTRGHTSCGARIAQVVTSDVKVRPGLLCKKCFDALDLTLKDGTAWKDHLNVKLICEPTN